MSRARAISPIGTGAAVYRWESERYAIPDERKIELAHIFEVSVDELMAHWEEEGE